MTVEGEGRPRAREDDRYEENVCESVPAHSHTQFACCLLLPAEGRSV